MLRSQFKLGDNIKILNTISAFILLTSCANSPLTAKENSVRILKKSDPEKACKEIAKVHAPGLASMTDEGREDDLKRATHKVGGNVVTLDRIDENRTLYGTAFSCPK